MPVRTPDQNHWHAVLAASAHQAVFSEAVNEERPITAKQPHLQPLRGNGRLEEGEPRIGHDNLERVLGW